MPLSVQPHFLRLPRTMFSSLTLLPIQTEDFVTLSLKDPIVRFSLFSHSSPTPLRQSRCFFVLFFEIFWIKLHSMVENFQLSQYQKWQTMRKCFFRSFHRRVFFAATTKTTTTTTTTVTWCVRYLLFRCVRFRFVHTSFMAVLFLFVRPFVRWIHRFHFSIAAFFNFPFRFFLYLPLSALHIFFIHFGGIFVGYEQVQCYMYLYYTYIFSSICTFVLLFSWIIQKHYSSWVS